MAEHGSEGPTHRQPVARGVRRRRSSARARSWSWSRPGRRSTRVIEELAPLLDEGDIDHRRRQLALPRHPAARRGDERARPALPRRRRLRRRGGRAARAEHHARRRRARPTRDVEHIFTTIAAQVDGTPCCTYVGADGAGHYVKMVHNGIEYADMQLIAEAYDLLRHGVGLEVPEIAQVFDEWNEGDLDSFLIEITAHRARQDRRATGEPLVDVILDQAEQKGTGRWTAQDALELGVPLTAITEAVFARSLSALRRPARGGVRAARRARSPARARASTASSSTTCARRSTPPRSSPTRRASSRWPPPPKSYGWDLDLGAMATIWRGGCIIRARFLDRIREAYDDGPGTPNLLLVAVLPRRGRRRPGLVAPGDRRARSSRASPVPGVLLLARLLRRLPARARAGEPDPGPARLLRRPHLPARRRRGLLPHALGQDGDEVRTDG